MYLLVLFLSISLIVSKGNLHNPKLMDEISKKYQNTNCGSDVFVTNSTLCFFKETSDDIPQISEHKVAGHDKAIFFIDTSCNGGLNFRQACAVEATARHHPERQINVLLAGPVAKHCLSTSPLWDLLTFPNVNIFRLLIRDFLRHTPVGKLIRRGELKFPSKNLIDILRYMVLYKFGGIYIDLDVVVVSPLNELPYPKNWVGKKHYNKLGLALLAMSKRGLGKKVSTAIMRLLKVNYVISKNKGKRYGNALQEVLQRICNTTDVYRMSAAICKGFEIYHQQYFYPISPENWKNFFRKPNTISGNKGKYAYHTWEQLSYNEPIYDDSLYAQLMRNNCPKIFQLML